MLTVGEGLFGLALWNIIAWMLPVWLLGALTGYLVSDFFFYSSVERGTLFDFVSSRCCKASEAENGHSDHGAQ